MDTILIVCGAGASSTFLASRLRRLQAAAQPSESAALDFTATAESELEARLPGSAALLVGSHLAERFPAIERRASAHGVPAVLLTPRASTPDGADEAIDLLLPLLSAESKAHLITKGMPHA